jgi:hypothetical protein
MCIKIQEAYRIACEAHTGKERSSGKAYIVHIDGVLEILWGNNEFSDILTWDDVIVAILHDVLEDHPEYFQLIYETFGYTITYRIITISKPTITLFEQWNTIISQQPDRAIIIKSPIYQLWSRAFSIDEIPGNTAQRLQIMGIIWSQFEEQYQLGHVQKTDILTLIRDAESTCVAAIKKVMNDTGISEKDAVKKRNKKWGEFLASLQLILISPSNLRIKLADKIFNLEDTDYRTIQSNKNNSSLKNKTTSILRTVPIYRYMADFYKMYRVRFEQAVEKSQVLDTIDSEALQSSTSI